jgi:predicted kinase
VACHANECVLRERLAERGAGGGDASDADVSVLRRQLVGIEPLDMDELMSAVVLDTANFDLHSLIHEIQQRIWSRN